MSLKTVGMIGGFGLLTSVLLWASCGPSFRRTYQSDTAFERCFDKDFDPHTPDGEKSACWGEWLAKYIYNQPDDKIRYAEMRRMEIAQGISVPGPPGMPGQFFKRPRLLVDAGPPRGYVPDAGVDGGAGRVLATSEE